MRIRPYAVAGLAVAALFAPAAGAAAPNTALVVADPTGDANFAEAHDGAVPVPNQAGQDIVSVSLDTTKVASKVGKKTVYTPTAVKVTLTFAAAVVTTPGASYGLNAEHSACGAMRLQVYYTPLGQSLYGDLLSCGTSDDPVQGDGVDLTDIMKVKVEGKTIVVEMALKALPKAFRAGSSLSEIYGYSTLAEPSHGYQAPDFGVPEGTIDVAMTDKAWKVA